LLTVTLLTITASSAVRLDDIIYGRIKHIPLKRTKPDGRFGFLREADFQQFDKELKELHSDSRARRSVDDAVRSSNRATIHEFELKGDNHTVAFLHWAGKKSPVIYIYTCAVVNQTQNDHILCENAFFWRSTNYGTTFKREDQQKFKLKGETKAKSINNVDFCLSNNRKVIVTSVASKYLFISNDAGNSFSPSPLNFVPHVISCNPLSDKPMIVGHDLEAKKVYYSEDGMRWQPLFEKVLRHYWGPGSKSEVFLEVESRKLYQSELWHVKLPGESKDVKIFDKTLKEFMSNTFEVAGKYLFVQKAPSSRGLYVFYRNNSNFHAGTDFFQHARFPLPPDQEEKEYQVVDASENEMMVVVKHSTGYYNLYVSDQTGVKYSLSLENILANKTIIWKKPTTLVDIHKVRSLNGTYLANVVFKDRFGEKVRSVISYNKGGEWHLLKAPEVDHNGVPTNCRPPYCSLHIHIVLSRWLFYIPGVLSSPSAVGIIIAQGNLGRRLGERRRIGVFMSNDGGLTWTKEFNYYYDFAIGDHGGILTAVPLLRSTDKVWYSCTEGKVWRNVTLDRNVQVFGMVTEPGETTLVVNLFGRYSSPQKFQWLSVKLNFTTVLNQKCQPENYTNWSPNDERLGGHCLLGQHTVYERRKSEDCCFNGEEYEREVNISACTCGGDDFECDFGFEHPELDEGCVATSSANPVPVPCPEGKTYQHSLGYRKVVGDRCVGGVEDRYKPEIRNCPIAAPKGLSITLDTHATAVEVNKQVVFHLKQQQGSTKITRYVWDFGDGSPVYNVTGFSRAKRVSHKFNKHGQFTVTLTAENIAGQSVVTADVNAYDPITSLEIDPPHAVVIGEEAWFNVTLHSNDTVDPDEYSPKHGFVLFLWSFGENNNRPMPTWDHEVSHTFSRAGDFKVSVQAVTEIGVTKGYLTVSVYEELTTVRLSFDFALEELKQNTKEWRSWLAERVQALLHTLLGVEESRLEVVVLRGSPTRVDVSITPAPTNDSKTREEIVRLLQQKVEQGMVEIHVTKDKAFRITHAEVLPDRGYIVDPTLIIDKKSGDSRLAIGIGIAASLVVIFLVLTLVYFLRRHHRLQLRYTHLRLYSEGGELRDRDPLMVDETETEDEQALHPQPGGALRYIALPTSTEPEPDSDEELIDNFQPGTLVVMPGGQNGQVQGENPNA